MKNGDVSDPAVSYNRFKEFEGRKYTGVKIGRGHTWNYDPGEWKEKKITPDLWEIGYAVTKRRKGRAPEGSGVPVGTEYHWYIVAHQNVTKINANDYTTSLAGLKFKVAHKRADTGKWSATEATQRKRMIKFLREVLHELEHPHQRRLELGAEEADGRTAAASKRPAAKRPTRTKAPATAEGIGATRGRRPAAPPSTRRPARRRRPTPAKG